MEITDEIRKRFELALVRKVIAELPNLSEAAKSEIEAKIEAVCAEIGAVQEVVGDDIRISKR